MPPTPIVTQTPSHHLHIRPLYIAIVTPVIIAGLAFAFIPSLRDGLGLLLHPVDEPMITEMPVALKPEVLGGSISLTLAKPGEAMGAYNFDVESGELIKDFANDSLDYFASMRSPDNTKIAVSTAVRSENHSVSLWVGDSDLNDLYEVKTGDALGTLEATSWSSDSSMIAMVGRAVGDDVSPEGFDQYNVYVFDQRSGKVSFVTNGTNALFTPSGTLLVLQDDGIHHIDLATGRNDLVISTNGGEVTDSMAIALSGDGSRLAWSDPRISKVSILNIESLRPFKYSIENALDIQATDVALSLKGEHVAAIEYSQTDAQEGAVTTIATLAAYTVDGQNMSGFVDVTPYLRGFTQINSWR